MEAAFQSSTVMPIRSCFLHTHTHLQFFSPIEAAVLAVNSFGAGFGCGGIFGTFVMKGKPPVAAFTLYDDNNNKNGDL